MHLLGIYWWKTSESPLQFVYCLICISNIKMKKEKKKEKKEWEMFTANRIFKNIFSIACGTFVILVIFGTWLKRTAAWSKLGTLETMLIIDWQMQHSQLGKKFNSKFLPLIFAGLKAFWRQKFSCLILQAERVLDWIILHSYVEKHIFGKKTFYWPTCI